VIYLRPNMSNHGLSSRVPEGDSMGKNARRICAAGFAIAASVTLSVPGTSAASPAPVVAGSCQDTLQGKTATGLTVDVGAAVTVPGVLTLGLDAEPATASANMDKAPLVSLPVGDAMKNVGLGNTLVAGDFAAQTVCPVVQDAANVVGNTTQTVLKSAEAVVPPLPVKSPGHAPQVPSVPPAAPGSGDQIGPIQTVPGSPTSGVDAISGIFIGGTLLPGNIAAPVVIPVLPTGQTPGADGVPPTVANRAGSAQALPASTPPARLPLMLAVLALAVVAAALVRTWIRRRPA
jgi:hypothetical protein